MNKKADLFKSSINRRDFLKKKVLGGFAFAIGIPFYPFKNIFQNSNLKPSISDSFSDEIDWDEIRSQFLIKDEKTYFNTASLGPSPKIVNHKICETLGELATKVKDGRWLIKDLHKDVAKFLNTTPEEIAITRNATEGMNIIARSLPLKAGDEILLTKHEHIGGSAPWIALKKEIGVKIKLIDLDLEGKNNLQLIKDNISNKTKVVSFSHITCTTGMILPAKEIVEFCRTNGIYSCVDGAQAMGMIPIDIADINPDFYAASGHKWIYGPKGTGILFINKSIINQCKPTYVGAYTDSKFDLNSLTLEYRNTTQREEYGTRNMPIVAGFGKAINFISTIGIQNIEQRGKELIKRCYFRLNYFDEVEILSPRLPELRASIITFRIKGKDSLTIRNRLNSEYSIIVRHIYENGIDGIRLSFSIFNSFKEVDQFADVIKDIIES